MPAALIRVPEHSGRLLPPVDGVIPIDGRLSDRLLQLRADLSPEQKPAPPVSGAVFHGEPATTEGEVLAGFSMIMAVPVDEQGFETKR